MTAALLALVLAPSVPIAFGAPDVREGEIRARFRCEPARVEVGEPFALILELAHPAGADVFELGRLELELDDSWVILDLRREPPTADPDDPARRITRRTWSLASLQPGERRLAESLTSAIADERVRGVDVGAATVEVVGVLGPGEDAPRPLRGFPPDFGRAPANEPSRWRWAALALAAVLWLAVGAVAWRRWRGRRGRPAPAGRSPLERLALLEREPAEDGAAVRARHFELTRLVRDAADRRLAREPGELGGLTDAEWMRAVRAELPDALETELAALLERAEAVKYGGAVPTAWAVEETMGHARRALEHATAGPLDEGGDGGGGAR